MANRNAHTIAAFDCNRVDSDNISNLDSLSGSGNYEYVPGKGDNSREQIGTYTDRGSVRVHKHCGEV